MYLHNQRVCDCITFLTLMIFWNAGQNIVLIFYMHANAIAATVTA